MESACLFRLLFSFVSMSNYFTTRNTFFAFPQVAKEVARQRDVWRRQILLFEFNIHVSVKWRFMPILVRSTSVINEVVSKRHDQKMSIYDQISDTFCGQRYKLGVPFPSIVVAILIPKPVLAKFPFPVQCLIFRNVSASHDIRLKVWSFRS